MDTGGALRRQLRAAGDQRDLGAVIVDVLSDAHREERRTSGYRGTRLGLDVMRRFAEAATRVRDEKSASGATRPLGGFKEYMSLVLPDQSGWREPDGNLDPGQRPVWVLDPEGGTCPTCGHEAVIPGVVRRMTGGNYRTVLSPETRCPLGHSLATVKRK